MLAERVDQSGASIKQKTVPFPVEPDSPPCLTKRPSGPWAGAATSEPSATKKMPPQLAGQTSPVAPLATTTAAPPPALLATQDELYGAVGASDLSHDPRNHSFLG